MKPSDARLAKEVAARGGCCCGVFALAGAGALLVAAISGDETIGAFFGLLFGILAGQVACLILGA